MTDHGQRASLTIAALAMACCTLAAHAECLPSAPPRLTLHDEFQASSAPFAIHDRGLALRFRRALRKGAAPVC